MILSYFISVDQILLIKLIKKLYLFIISDFFNLNILSLIFKYLTLLIWRINQNTINANIILNLHTTCWLSSRPTTKWYPTKTYSNIRRLSIWGFSYLITIHFLLKTNEWNIYSQTEAHCPPKRRFAKRRGDESLVSKRIPKCRDTWNHICSYSFSFTSI